MVMMQLQRLRDCSGSSEAGRRDRCGPPWELRSGQRRARRHAHQWPPPLSLLLLLHQQLLPERPLVLAPARDWLSSVSALPLLLLLEADACRVGKRRLGRCHHLRVDRAFSRSRA